MKIKQAKEIAKRSKRESQHEIGNRFNNDNKTKCQEVLVQHKTFTREEKISTGIIDDNHEIKMNNKGDNESMERFF